MTDKPQFTQFTRRDFLKFSAATLGSTIAPGKLRGWNPIEASQIKFNVNVVPFKKDKDYSSSPLIFTNAIDFAGLDSASSSIPNEERKMIPPFSKPQIIANNQSIVGNEISNKTDIKQVIVTATYGIYPDKKTEDFETQKRKIISGVLTSAGGVAGTIVDTVMAIDENVADIIPAYPVFALLSDIRAMIIMDDLWKNTGAEYHNEPILAISFSVHDGLEAFAQRNIKELKNMLLDSHEFDTTLIESCKANKLVSVAQLFDIDYTQYLSTKVHKLSDEMFLAELEGKLNKFIPKPDPDWQENA